MWVLGVKPKSSCSFSKHFLYWAIFGPTSSSDVLLHLSSNIQHDAGSQDWGSKPWSQAWGLSVLLWEGERARKWPQHYRCCCCDLSWLGMQDRRTILDSKVLETEGPSVTWPWSVSLDQILESKNKRELSSLQEILNFSMLWVCIVCSASSVKQSRQKFKPSKRMMERMYWPGKWIKIDFIMKKIN